ncbi:splicing factor ESS-2 family protein [Aspergillus candidus]|uniref:Nuclear protein DGCR14 n=1 Tax=Aspergillus candidus TaxID=41067 RepID=A0A2I2F275_ASPCN|nr:nuclear protein DGCR14 [Aspergillus candidus]PLB34708.1 nuclear protein DGCR14 [Aspergillus candidus]
MSSQALTKRQSESALMPPPPPPKRIKRPATVLDEDVYTNVLSDIIARDYFPGLLEAQVKQDYLDALDSKDKEWIATSKRRLVDVLRTPGRARPRPAASGTTPQFSDVGDTPTGWRGETPLSVGSATPSTVAPTQSQEESAAPDVSRLGLLEFQAKYTSEDNESFNKVLDKQNAKRREHYAWMWSGNKVPTARQIAHHRRETKRIEAQGGTPSSDPTTQAVAIKTDLDARPAKPDAWKARPENPLMFAPQSIEDDHETIQQRAEAASRAGPKHVVYQNTRLPDETHRPAAPPPPSPSISAIKDAIAGRPRLTDSEPGFTGGETPRVNGYAFVDEDEPDSATTSADDFNDLLGSSDPQDRTPNPFSIRENRHREALHHRMVDRVSRKKRAEKAARETKTPVSRTPRFASSPRLDFGSRGHPPAGGVTPGKALTPAAQKLLHQVGGSTPRTPGFSASSSSGLRNLWTPTPKRGK